MYEKVRSGLRRVTVEYNKDHILDNIDIKAAIEKNKTIPKIDEELFIYRKKETSEKLLNESKFQPIDWSTITFILENSKEIPAYDIFTDFKKIGEGAFSTVYSAYDKKMKMRVAIKVISKNCYSEETAEFTRREAAIQNSLNHKNLLKLHSVKENFDFLFLVMELVEGGSLRDIIYKKYYHEKSFFQESECSVIIKNILEGLEYMHSKNIMHRDIKPENIMFSDSNDYNSVKLADFGFSVYSENDREDKVCGTPIYKSPELFLGNSYDHYVDFWATGFILYILCSGGCHPIYREGMDIDQYTFLFRQNKEWWFPPDFPKLARNLFIKLCKYNKIYRYDSSKSLAHPWITRDVNSSIPMTLMETYNLADMLRNFKSLLLSSVFFATYKKDLVDKSANSTYTNAKTSSKKSIMSSVRNTVVVNPSTLLDLDVDVSKKSNTALKFKDTNYNKSTTVFFSNSPKTEKVSTKNATNFTNTIPSVRQRGSEQKLTTVAHKNSSEAKPTQIKEKSSSTISKFNTGSSTQLSGSTTNLQKKSTNNLHKK